MDFCPQAVEGFLMGSHNQGGITAFDMFPPIKKLGVQRLQELCNEWMKTPRAREFAVTLVEVSAPQGEIHLRVGFTFTHDVQDGEEVRFPMDDLLYYINDNGVAEGERAKLRELVRGARRAGGPKLFQAFIVRLGPKFPLFVNCKNPSCRVVIQTNWMARKNEKYRLKNDSVSPNHEGS